MSKNQSVTPAQSALTIKSVRNDIDVQLSNFYEEKIAHATTFSQDYASLLGVMRDLSKSGGKRLRPYILLLAYRMYGGVEYNKALKTALAQELLHFAMLVHDDIIDRDTRRYGTANIAGVYHEKYARYSDAPHYALSNALLAGDIAIAGAFECIASSGLPSEKIAIATNQLSEAIFYVAGGEMIDTETAIKEIHEVDPHVIAEYKTAKYSCVGPLVMGATLANASDLETQKLQSLGTHMGIAFQLVDDMLGVFGDADVTGKSNSSDLREGKKTLLYKFAHESTKGQDAQTLSEYFGRADLSKKGADLIRGVFISSGASDRVQHLIDEHISKSRHVIDSLDVEDSHKQSLIELLMMLTERSK